MFRGRFEHSLDDKGRLAIPSRFRDNLINDQVSEESASPTVVITNFDRCLAVYSLTEWEQLEKKIASLPQFDPQVVSFLRYFVSGATESTIDKAGRVLIPSTLRQFADIQRDCIIAGQLTKFEVWARDRWDDMFGQLSDQFVHITNSMAQHGITL